MIAGGVPIDDVACLETAAAVIRGVLNTGANAGTADGRLAFIIAGHMARKR